MATEIALVFPAAVRPGYLRFVGAIAGSDGALAVALRVDRAGALQPPTGDPLDRALGPRRPIALSDASTFWLARFERVWSFAAMEEGWEGDTGIGRASRAATGYAPAVEVFDSQWVGANFALWRAEAEREVARHFAIFTIDRTVHVVAPEPPRFAPRARGADDE